MQNDVNGFLTYILLILPLVLLFLKQHRRPYYHIVLIVCVFFVLNSVILVMPRHYPGFAFFDSRWNWSGKLLALIYTIIFILISGKSMYKQYGLSLVMNWEYKWPVIGLITLVMLVSGINAFSPSMLVMDWETLLFQLTAPAIEEELAFRGVMLGLLNMVLRPRLLSHHISPANVIVSVLFALSHALQFQAGYEWFFQPIFFIKILFIGLVMGYITEKTGSILIPVLLHGASNFLLVFLSMV